MWEKVSDYCLDVSKYFLTAAFVATLMEDLSDIHWLIYLIAFIFGTGLFCLGIYLDRRERKKKEEKRRKYKKFNKNNRRV